ncbi:MAG TPA: DUF4349 domain-containing protein [bacterium]|nr:DUF4349 domain-containing protein [bacterium]
MKLFRSSAWLLMLVLAAFAGCGATASTPEEAAPQAAGYSRTSGGFAGAADAEMAKAVGATPAMPPAAAQPSGTAVPAVRKLIVNGDIGVEVNDFAAAAAQLEQLVTAAGGYITNASSEEQSSGGRRGSIEVKIAPDKLNAFLADVRKLGDVKSENRRTDDVSMEYVDLSARLATKRQLEQELLGLLHTSSPRLSEKLEVERELARVREEIETTQGRLKHIDTLAAMATITVSLFEPETVAPEDENIIFNAFKDGVEGLLHSVGALIIFIFYAAPWLLALLLLLFVVRAWWRRRKAGRA